MKDEAKSLGARDMPSYLHLASVVVVQVLLDLARVKSAFGVEGMGERAETKLGHAKKKRENVVCALPRAPFWRVGG